MLPQHRCLHPHSFGSKPHAVRQISANLAKVLQVLVINFLHLQQLQHQNDK